MKRPFNRHLLFIGVKAYSIILLSHFNYQDFGSISNSFASDEAFHSALQEEIQPAKAQLSITWKDQRRANLNIDGRTIKIDGTQKQSIEVHAEKPLWMEVEMNGNQRFYPNDFLNVQSGSGNLTLELREQNAEGNNRKYVHFTYESNGGDIAQPSKAQSTISSSSLLANVYNIDSDASEITWKGSILQFGGVALYSHYGEISVANGEITVENGRVSKGKIVVDMTTINPKDNNYGDVVGQGRSDLIHHLSSDDFFAVSEFPYSVFNFHFAKDGTMIGDLEIRGISKKLTFDDIEIRNNGDLIQAVGRFVFDRQDFNVRFNLGAQERMLSDQISVGFDIVAKKTTK